MLGEHFPVKDKTHNTAEIKDPRGVRLRLI
nr:MAG TPA: hypothetical protein [Caudoviricetes sp.]